MHTLIYDCEGLSVGCLTSLQYPSPSHLSSSFIWLQTASYSTFYICTWPTPFQDCDVLRRRHRWETAPISKHIFCPAKFIYKLHIPGGSLCFLDLKLSPCSECKISLCGLFTGVDLVVSDNVSKRCQRLLIRRRPIVHITRCYKVMFVYRINPSCYTTQGAHNGTKLGSVVTGRRTNVKNLCRNAANVETL